MEPEEKFIMFFVIVWFCFSWMKNEYTNVCFGGEV